MITVIDQLKQKNNQSFPLADVNDLKGGFIQVGTLGELFDFPVKRIKDGMLAYVVNITGAKTHWYQYLNNQWNEADFNSASIPVLDQATLDSLSVKPEKYVAIPSEDDLDGYVDASNTYTTSVNGTYVDVLFKAIRALQSEVAKLRNSFIYGINSYTGTHTAKSAILQDEDNDIKEPLWAIDPESLSLIDSLTIGDGNQLEGTSIDASFDGKIIVNGDATYTSSYIRGNEDSKLIFYFTVTKPNIKINLLNQDNEEVVIDLGQLISSDSIQNIMVVISRKTKADNDLVGYNFVYINSYNYNTDEEIVRGYYNGTTLQSIPYYIDDILKFDYITLSDLTISKLEGYSKYQDFSYQVIPSKPSTDDYKYDVAHITIRAVTTYAALSSIAAQLPENELIYCKSNNKLYIKTNNNIKAISGGSGGGDPIDEGMTETELLQKLSQMGIITNEDNGELQISNLSDITFINEETGNQFNLRINPYGEIEIRDVYENDLEQRLVGVTLNDWDVRGLVGQLGLAEHNSDTTLTKFTRKSNLGLWSDRIKIGAIYLPLKTDKIFGCTNAYIELENTSNKDFQLRGCYLHWAHIDDVRGMVVDHLKLTGVIPAGGTYLIRGVKYAEANDANTFINVDTYDQEWYINNKLADFTYNNTDSSTRMGFALTYGNEELAYNTQLVQGSTRFLSQLGLTTNDETNFPTVYDKSFIDSIYIGAAFVDSSDKGYWSNNQPYPLQSNSIYKNTFELDPANQAYQSLNTKDSSRARWANTADYQELSLEKEFISFPKSDDIYPVSYFTPKASFQKKNVSTDKSKLSKSKPNMVTCSFGKDIFTTRCFNWLSVGYFDEYVFIKNGDSYTAVESYKAGGTDSTGLRVEFDATTQAQVYNRMTGRFPADNTFYTSHKCIIKLTAPSTKTTYTYIVGRADKNGNPDFEHCSEEYTFTIYPNTYTPRIYQVSDQQGFHWIEYQVWAAAAKKLNDKINTDCAASNIIPILINTGDMTQNGTRINEWLDYYNAGKCLFTHLEQMNVVGNNDLCGTDYSILGTGDDAGKSNSYYFHLFYCYEIDNAYKPIINGKYIPSLYYFDSKDYRFVMVNSEITYENCTNWFNMKNSAGTTINIYTGYTVPKNGETQTYVTDFTSIYTMLYHYTDTTKKLVVACHELPFTVITRASLKTDQKPVSRSISDEGKLVGSHLNQLCPEDNAKGVYWFSRLMEFRGINIAIGGHKHTYECTYPVREYYYYNEGTKNSKDNGIMTMTETLQNDDAIFLKDSVNLSKMPLTKRDNIGTGDTTSFYPYTPVPSLTGGITYFMCQATGFKLKSNKELPSPDQKFSIIIPKTGTNAKTGADSPDANQQYPMFAIISFGTNTTVKLARIDGILSNKTFTQTGYDNTKPMTLQYLKKNSTDNYGTWQNGEEVLITI